MIKDPKKNRNDNSADKKMQYGCSWASGAYWYDNYFQCQENQIKFDHISGFRILVPPEINRSDYD
ncbi:MAG: hypothetical protein ACTSYF_05100 [Promethearchaeota archaeon]